ncbi:hypothetical protein BJP40_01220 [Streptomyces sp. CC53]|uniref:CAP domain-containing protein n=1 Tax=unclassified Streptomyces TaxID=2593676 RepID=UPI0008DE84AB|nr:MULTISPECIES: CAP domain-containing protein [unclassified Streptomyces]OII65541.1 hypothetical protein BJP40_01220 [Streptomyces sp. CC53]
MEQAVLERINAYRARHHAPPVTLDQNLNGIAADRARQCTGRPVASSSPPYLTNVAAGVYSNPELYVDAWYETRTGYDYDSGTMSDFSAGNFTLMVWNEVTTIGVGFADTCESSSPSGFPYELTVAFGPTGNVPGAFKANVNRPDPTVPLPTPAT